jgi:hypothetical protein
VCNLIPPCTLSFLHTTARAMSAAQQLTAVTWHINRCATSSSDDTIVVTVHISSGAQLDPSPTPSPFFTQQARATSVTWQLTMTEPHSVNTTTSNNHLLQSSFDAPNTDPNNNNQAMPHHQPNGRQVTATTWHVNNVPGRSDCDDACPHHHPPR